ncbi:MAG: hypothetical protein ABGY24_16375, partial [bacterium]
MRAKPLTACFGGTFVASVSVDARFFVVVASVGAASVSFVLVVAEREVVEEFDVSRRPVKLSA